MSELITVTGAIAAGATTLSRRLIEVMGWEPALEIDVESGNPFFSRYHQNPDRYAFHNQVAFLTQSAEAHQRMRSLDRVLVQDFSPFEHTEVYAYVQHGFGRLSDDEYGLLRRLHNVLSEVFLRPNVLVYRDLPQENLVARVEERARPSEQGIDPDFLRAVRERFEEWIARWDRGPVVRVPAHFDAVAADEAAVRKIGHEIEQYLR